MNDMKAMFLLLIVVLSTLMNMPVESAEMPANAVESVAAQQHRRVSASRNCPIDHCLLLVSSKAPQSDVEPMSGSNIGLLRDVLIVKRCIEAERHRCAAQVDMAVSDECSTMCGGQALDEDCVRRHCTGNDGVSQLSASSTAGRHRGAIAAESVDDSCRKSCAILAPSADKEAECIKKFCGSAGNGIWSTNQAVDSDEGDIDIIDGDATGSRSRSIKRWGNRIGRRSEKGATSMVSDDQSDGGGMEDVVDPEADAQSSEAGTRSSKMVKRWGSRVCLEAHCRSYEKNRSAFVACGQRFCGRRRR